MVSIITKTQHCKEWVRDNATVPYSKLNDGILISPRFITEIVEGMEEEGLLENEDYEVEE